jgi:hypothetical protein
MIFLTGLPPQTLIWGVLSRAVLHSDGVLSFQLSYMAE